LILLIDNYDSFTWNLYQYLGELGAEVEVVRNDAVGLEDIELMGAEKIIISPGPGSPDTAGISLDVIRRFSGKVPILGVCLGHQCIGQAFGGNVVRAPELLHGKTSAIMHNDKGVFSGLDNPFEATRYHSLVVDRDSLPDSLEVTATTASGLIMGVRHRELEVEGVQFHPESILTTSGKQLLNNFLHPGEARKENDD
jgi:anthranilate synthase/aminodeoxychorismate synthase-like glutamine amidotransferase